MTSLRLVLADQLTRTSSALRDLDLARDVVLMVEVVEEATYVKHHKQKIAFLYSAMRHFAQSLREEGVTVDYVKLDDPANVGSLTGELARAVKHHAAERVVVTEPGEWRVREAMNGWAALLGLPVDIRVDDRFYCSRAEFEAWAQDRNSLRMEFFYRDMRRKTGLLMEGKEPVGGQWNLDAQNREALPQKVFAPERAGFQTDETTREVIALVAARFADHFGDLDGFRWAVTREDALQALDEFIETYLPTFGAYQDAMREGDDFLFHAVLSPYINSGLLTPREVVKRANEAYRAGDAPLNSVEGFIRQILGWREYVRGIYWLKMPEYKNTNYLAASRTLPKFYWTGETKMACLADAIGATKRNAYAHHIQRLMVTGNFALIAGLSPREVEEWYLIVYADAYEWVELPNVHGMILFADGGLLGSKPYAASGAYINRMSNYCRGCAYDVNEKLGPKACPFNYLYWNFLIENTAALRGNMRLAMPYRTLEKMTPGRKAQIAADSRTFLDEVCQA